MENLFLKELRVKKQLTQCEMANTLNITLRQYQRYEAGTSLPRVDAAIEMAKFFDTTVEELFGNKSL